jgi:GntR family transcriptional regulator, transcriptional repressor for pyruvate dehydrogenase complex
MEEPRRSDGVSPPRPIPISPRLGRNRREKAAETIARELVHEIVVQGRQPGDSLDSEQVMLERFRVSRDSLREALRLLEVQGLITIRRGPGGGAFVGTVDPFFLGRTSSLYYQLAGATYGELFEAYSFADAALAERAATSHGTARRRSAMQPYLDVADEQDPERYLRIHSAFHVDVAALAGNRVLQINLQSTGLLVGRHYVALADTRRDRPFVADEHTAIADAIITGRPMKAHRLMKEHVDRIITGLCEDGLDPEALIEWV